MIPYVYIPTLTPLPGMEISVFGICFAVGILIGMRVTERAAVWYAPGDARPLEGMLIWAVVPGILFAHAWHVFLYHPELLKTDGVGVVFRLWDGLSSMGGVLGGTFGIALYLRRRKVPIRPYLDALALGATCAWALGRVGCALVHDHPGRKTDFFLAVNFPPELGGPRHDLGLYEAILLGGIALVLYLIARRGTFRARQGFLMGLFIALYTPARFFLDFLRATDTGFDDARYAGLTPAQYCCLLLFPVGLWLLGSGSRLTGAPHPSYTPSGTLEA